MDKDLSLCVFDGLYASLIALLITPLFSPAGENHGNDVIFVLAIIPATSALHGIYLNLFENLS